MAIRDNKISLGNVTFNPATFQGATFTPKQQNISILQHSLDKLDERKEKTDQQRAAIRTAFGQVKLNAAEDEWKNNYVNDIINKINSAVNFGDQFAAAEIATDLASKALSDPALLGRIRANEQYEKEKITQETRRDKNEISHNTYNWWQANNLYKYSDTYDNNGNIVGGTEYEPTFRPVNDINWASAAMAAFKMVTPYKSSISEDGGNTVTNHTTATITRNGNTYKPGESISKTSHSSTAKEKVTKEQITARMEELLSATQDGYRQAEQAYDVAKYEFDKMLSEYDSLIAKNLDSEDAKILGQKIDQRKKLMYRNGSPIDYKEYYARMITDSLFAEGLAYDWRTINSGGTNSYSISDVNVGSGGTRTSNTWFPGATFDSVSGFWYGPPVRQNVDTESAQQEVNGATNGITGRFNK